MRYQDLGLLFILLFTTSLFAQQSSLVYKQNGKLVYTPFAMQGQTNEVNTVPDFSHAGYMGGGIALPDLPVKATVSPIAGDDAELIQNAIDEVSALPLDENGFRGAVLLKAGHYSLSRKLRITASGVVLRGEGQGMNGTVLHYNVRHQLNGDPGSNSGRVNLSAVVVEAW